MGILKKCRVANCGLRNSDGVTLFSLLKDNDRRDLWITTVKWGRMRCDILSENFLVCSKHFRTGKPVKPYYSKRHPDWVPSLLLGGPQQRQVLIESPSSSDLFVSLESESMLIESDELEPIAVEVNHGYESFDNSESLSSNASLDNEPMSDPVIHIPKAVDEEIIELGRECHPNEELLNLIAYDVVEPVSASIISGTSTTVKLKTKVFLTEERLKVSEEEVKRLTEKLAALETPKAEFHFSVKKIESFQKACQFYTCIDSYEKFWMLLNWIAKFLPRENQLMKLNYRGQFLLTLMKLRLNLRIQDLAY